MVSKKHRAVQVPPDGGRWVTVRDVRPVGEAIRASTLERVVDVCGHRLRRYLTHDGRRWVTDSYNDGMLRMRTLPWPWEQSWNRMVTEIRSESC